VLNEFYGNWRAPLFCRQPRAGHLRSNGSPSTAAARIQRAYYFRGLANGASRAGDFNANDDFRKGAALEKRRYQPVLSGRQNRWKRVQGCSAAFARGVIGPIARAEAPSTAKKERDAIRYEQRKAHRGRNVFASSRCDPLRQRPPAAEEGTCRSGRTGGGRRPRSPKKKEMTEPAAEEEAPAKEDGAEPPAAEEEEMPAEEAADAEPDAKADGADPFADEEETKPK